MTDKARDQELREKLLAYELGIDDADERAEIEGVLAGDEAGQRTRERLAEILRPLGSWEDEEPAGDLRERTLARIAQHEQAQRMAQTSAAIAAQERKPVKLLTKRDSRWWSVVGNVRDVVSVAACLLLVFMLARPTLQQARQRSHQIACASNLRTIGSALSSYAGDHDGYMPYVPQQDNAPWWHIGRQCAQNVSHTRNAWLLVKGGYAEPKDFLCPGAPYKRTRVYRIQGDKIQVLHDFISRDAVSYSFRLTDPKPHKADQMEGPLMADKNPLFAAFNSETQQVLDLTEHAALLQANSPNHRGEGQNVLFDDGSARFMEKRYLPVEAGLDDIFTIREVQRYKGVERPDSKTDIFIP